MLSRRATVVLLSLYTGERQNVKPILTLVILSCYTERMSKRKGGEAGAAMISDRMSTLSADADDVLR